MAIINQMLNLKQIQTFFFGVLVGWGRAEVGLNQTLTQKDCSIVEKFSEVYMLSRTNPNTFPNFSNMRTKPS